MESAAECVARYLAALGMQAAETGSGEWVLGLDAGGFDLHVELQVRGPLVRAQAAVLPAGLIDPHQLLYWNRQAPLVCFAENGDGEVYVCGEIPVVSLDPALLDQFLGLLHSSAARARQFAIQNAA